MPSLRSRWRRSPRATRRTAGRRSHRCRPGSCRRRPGCGRARGRARRRAPRPSARGSRARCTWDADGRTHDGSRTSVRTISAWPRRCPATRRSPTSSTCWPTCRSCSARRSFRVLAYRRAATRIRDTPASAAQLALDGQAKELPGIGATIEQKIAEVGGRGDACAHASPRRGPGRRSTVHAAPGLGPKTAARIWNELGITTLAELRTAAEEQRLRTLTGLGAKTEEKILRALDEGMGERQPERGLGAASRSCASSSSSSAPTRPPIASRRLAASGAVGRPFETSTSSLPRRTRRR